MLRKAVFSVSLLLSALVLTACSSESSPESAVPESSAEKVSYFKNNTDNAKVSSSTDAVVLTSVLL